MPKIKTAGYTHAKMDAAKRQRKHEAEERNAHWKALPLSDKIASLEARGGSKKQLAKLAKKKSIVAGT